VTWLLDHPASLMTGAAAATSTLMALVRVLG